MTSLTWCVWVLVGQVVVGGTLVADEVPHWVLEAVGSAADELVQRLVIVCVEWWLAREQDEEDDSTRPQVHLGAILDVPAPLHVVLPCCLSLSDTRTRAATCIRTKIQPLAWQSD